MGANVLKSTGVLISQWEEHPSCVTEIVGANPAEDSDFLVVLLPFAKQLVFHLYPEPFINGIERRRSRNSACIPSLITCAIQDLYT